MWASSRYKTLTIIIVLCAVPRLTLVAAALVNNNGDAATFAREDSEYYLRTAAILAGKDREDFPYEGAFVHKIDPRAFKSLVVPLYPLFLSLVFRIFGPVILLPVFLNILFFSAASCFLYRTGEVFFQKRTALLATALFCIYPSTIIYSIIAMPESMFMLFLLSGVYFFAVFLKKGTLPPLVLSSLLITLSCLTKEISIFIPVVMALLLLSRLLAGRKNAITGLVLLAMTYAVLLSPLLVMNYSRNLRVSVSSNFSSHMRYFTKKATGKHPAYKTPADYLSSRVQFFAGTGAIATLRVLGYDVSKIEASTNHPRDYLQSLGQQGRIWPIYQYAGWGIAGLLYLASIAGFIRQIYRREFLSSSFCAAFPLYFLAAYYYHKHPTTRYFVPIVPFLALLSADFISAMWTILTKKGASQHARG